MDQPRLHLDHIDYPIKAQAQKYASSGGKRVKLPSRNVQEHGKRVLEQYRAAIEAARDDISQNLSKVTKVRYGYYLEFEGASEHELNLESLDARPLELLAVKQVGNVFKATVFVPEHEIQRFEKKIQAYLTQKTADKVGRDGQLREGRPRHQSLLDPIEHIQLADLRSLWMDDEGLFPEAGDQIWWEIWVPGNHAKDFEAALKVCDLRQGGNASWFPERAVYAVLATREQINILRLSSGSIAELRRIKDTANLFTNLSAVQQVEWVDNLLERTVWAEGDAPSVCLLDTGVNNGHKLLAPALSADDMHACDEAWPKADVGQPAFHGTAMAGVALYGDLQHALTTTEDVLLTHRLESVRILPAHGSNPENLYGAITSKGVSLTVENAPDRVRSFCLAITAPNYFGGRPSEWSATIDGWCFHHQHLFCISAGNVTNTTPSDSYKAECFLSPIEDPAQSWNAITVGASTDKIVIDEPDYEGWNPLARAGDLSPHSRTSVSWAAQWPIKPEIHFEGGNWAVSPAGEEWLSDLDSLSLITTHPQFLVRPLTTIRATSAAVAQANYLLAKLQARYPRYCSETFRGLMIHGASWAPGVFEHLRGLSKTDRGIQLRAYGYGVASESASLFSEKTRCVVVTEQVIQPFKKKSGSQVEMNEVHFIRLPLPKECMEGIGNELVRLKVTLSYFVDPNPSQRGYGYRFSYASHGLRFVLQKPGESLEELKTRAGRLSKKDDPADEDADDDVRVPDHWFLGPKARNKGCVISDVWEEPATDLAQHEYLAVYPVGGWWKTRYKHGRGDTKTRYSVVMSLETAATEVDLYNEVATMVTSMVAAEAAVDVEIDAKT